MFSNKLQLINKTTNWKKNLNFQTANLAMWGKCGERDQLSWRANNLYLCVFYHLYHVKWPSIFLSVFHRATIQSPRLHPASGTSPSPPAALSDSSQPVPGIHAPRWPFAEFGSASNPSYWKPGPCGRPITSRAADHAPRERPAARQLGAGQQCATGNKVNRCLTILLCIQLKSHSWSQ